jgi:hypothetical protein
MIKFRPHGRIRRPSPSKCKHLPARVREDIHDYILSRSNRLLIATGDLVGQLIEDAFATLVDEEMFELGLAAHRLTSDELRAFYRGEEVPPMDAQELADRSGLSLDQIFELAEEGCIKGLPGRDRIPNLVFDRRWAIEWARSDLPQRLIEDDF